jgi:hypothetical protein
MFDPEDFAKLAVRLVQNPCGPADSRTAISRAYYAAFLYARKLLDPHFYFSGEGKVHTEIRFLFVNSTREELRKIGQQLDDLRGKRNAADYDLAAQDVNIYHNARLHVAISTRLIGRLKQVFSSDWSSTIREMEEYARNSQVARCR